MTIQKKIKHIIILMLENRSFDNVAGWLYDSDNPPSHFLPAGSPDHYAGLANTTYSNPTSFNAQSATTVPIKRGTDNYHTPSHDPNESFPHINRQLFGANIDTSTPSWLPPAGATPTMNGFLMDYSMQDSANPEQIMQTYTPEQLPVISSLARNFAICDNYHASTPTQTFPNRAFMYAGTSLGRVNNKPYVPFDTKTIFKVLAENDISWKVYRGSKFIPSLTRMLMFDLWRFRFDSHFHTIGHFLDDCRNGSLPAVSLIEPMFLWDAQSQLSLEEANSAHPPSNIYHSEVFLSTIANAITASPAFNDTLFIVNYDEHGGMPDHIPTNWTATPPDKDSQPGNEGFNFNRFGVRVPLLMMSPYIQAGTVFRANTDPFSAQAIPFDHTSLLALIMDWQNIARTELPSKRVQQADISFLDQLLSLDTPRSDVSIAQPTEAMQQQTVEHADRVLSSLEKSIIMLHEYYRTWDGGHSLHEHIHCMKERVDKLAERIATISDAKAHLKSLITT